MLVRPGNVGFWHPGRRAIASAAATNIELAVSRGVLRAETFDSPGVLGENVTCAWLAVADWRAVDRSGVLPMP